METNTTHVTLPACTKHTYTHTHSIYNIHINTSVTHMTHTTYTTYMQHNIHIHTTHTCTTHITHNTYT